MAENEVRLRITTDSSAGVAGVNQYRSSLDGLVKSADGISSRLKGLFSFTIAGVGLYQMASIGKDLAQLGARAQQVEESYRLMAESVGINAEKTYQAMKSASKGIMDDSDIMQKAAKGLAQGLEGKQLIAIASGARYAARLAGEDVKTAYETITDAIANQMPKALKRYGLVTKQEMDLLNRAIAAGVEDTKLADIALANLAIQTGRFGTEVETSDEKLQRLSATWNNFKEGIGKGIVATIDFVFNIPDAPVIRDVVKDIMEARGKYTDEEISRAAEKLFGAKSAYRSKITAERPYDPTSEGNLLRAEAERDKFWAVEKMKTAIAEKEGQKRVEQLAKLNDRIDDLWARNTLTAEEQAYRLAAVWEDEGASRWRVERWLAAELKKIRDNDEAKRLERLGKIEQAEREHAWSVAEIWAEASARDISQRLGFRRTILAEQEGMGFIGASDRLVQEFDLTRKTLEAEEGRLRVLIARRSQDVTEDDLRGQREILKLALEHREISQQLLEVEELRILRMKEFSGSFSEGLDAGARKYFSEIEGSFRRGRTLSEQTARGMEQAFSDGFFAVFTGQVDSLEDVWLSFCHSMARAWSDTLAQMIMESLKGYGGGGGLGSILSTLLGFQGGFSGASPGDQYFQTNELMTWASVSAKGNAFRSGRLVPFASGGVFDQPTVFRMATGMGLMAEEGPEAVMPLGRTATGELGVKASGGGGNQTVFIIHAIDTQSFHDVCRRNPQAITQTVSSEMKDGKLKHWRSFLGN